MTPDEILALPAGRELDALVAEHVLGLVPCSDPTGRCDLAKTSPVQCWGTGGAGTELPCYSTDVAAAWAVVEHLADAGHVLHVKADGLRPPRLRYTAIGVRGRLGVDCGSAPLAICRAALLLVGGSS